MSPDHYDQQIEAFAASVVLLASGVGKPLWLAREELVAAFDREAERVEVDWGVRLTFFSDGLDGEVPVITHRGIVEMGEG